MSNKEEIVIEELAGQPPKVDTGLKDDLTHSLKSAVKSQHLESLISKLIIKISKLLTLSLIPKSIDSKLRKIGYYKPYDGRQERQRSL